MSALMSRKLLFDSNNNHMALFLNYLLHWLTVSTIKLEQIKIKYKHLYHEKRCFVLSKLFLEIE